MKIIFEDDYSSRYKVIVLEKANLLKEFFNFDPSTISPYKIKFKIVSSLEEMNNLSFEINGVKPAPDFVVGITGSGGKIYVLDKMLFPLKTHKEDEFENVILHELCHIFFRRFMDPKKVSVWIEEGLCEFLSFRDYPLNIGGIVDFKEIESVNGWRKHYSYQQSRAFFAFIEKKYSIGLIIELLNEIKKNGEKGAFDKLFGGFEMLKKDFISFLENEKIISPGQAM